MILLAFRNTLAARVLELRSQRKQRKYAEKLKEEERKRRIEAKRNRLEQEQDEEAARESAESFLKTEVEKLQQQFAMVIEQQKKDREDSEHRIFVNFFRGKTVGPIDGYQC